MALNMRYEIASRFAAAVNPITSRFAMALTPQ
jgi:hypothetical protein